METVTKNPGGRVRHPVFARVYPRIARWADAHGSVEHRGELLEGISGRVIEIGAGHGANFQRYPPEVTEVLAVEPEPRLRELAQAAAAQASIPVTVVEGTAEGLPAGDAEFDAAVASLVLCSVHDPAIALAEIQRVLRPGGELRFYEHVRSRHAGLARYQRIIDWFWPYLAGGCHVDRPTADTIAAAGFTMDRLRHFRFPPSRIPSASSPCIAELVCLAVAQVLLGARSEHHWLRMCYARLGHLFPYLPKQPGYHKRVKAALPLICKATVYLTSLCPSWADELRLLDATAVPCGRSRETVKRSELAGWANYGYCASHSGGSGG